MYSPIIYNIFNEITWQVTLTRHSLGLGEEYFGVEDVKHISSSPASKKEEDQSPGVGKIA